MPNAATLGGPAYCNSNACRKAENTDIKQRHKMKQTCRRKTKAQNVSKHAGAKQKHKM